MRSASQFAPRFCHYSYADVTGAMRWFFVRPALPKLFSSLDRQKNTYEEKKRLWPFPGSIGYRKAMNKPDDDKQTHFYFDPADITPILAGLFMLFLTVASAYFFFFSAHSPFEIFIPKEKTVQTEIKPVQGMMPASAVDVEPQAPAKSPADGAKTGNKSQNSAATAQP